MEKYDREKVESHFESERNTTKNPSDYTIDTPPPTVSGDLHLGHVYQYIIQDIPARYNRLKGNRVFFPFGYDNNGIATERFVEREAGVDRTEVPKEEFDKLCEEHVENKMRDYKDKMRRLGVSIDWDEEYETISHSVQRISQMSFAELYDKNRLYTDKEPTIWCPECGTAISQAETESLDMDGSYNRIRFEIVESDEFVDIETTRPELLPACVAIFVHPDDSRASKLVGEKAKVPLFNHEVEILADERVDRNEGTGIVMCCTFGDTTDIEWYRTHNLDLRVAVDENGKMTERSEKYSGMDINDARDAITSDLDSSDYLIDSRPIEHSVQVHGRCDTPTEFRVTKQWFIKLLDKKNEYLELAEKLNWIPEEMQTRYKNWVKGLEWDWCISRQRDVGIPFPVWYCSDCDEPHIERDDLPVIPQNDSSGSITASKEKNISIDSCPKCGCTKFVPETDVMDTWATSSLTPLINAGWMGENEFAHPDRYPMSVRPQGHDIISTWLFYTVVKCYEHTGEVPFNDVLINGHILDENMEKMSASRGNVVEPDSVIESYSIDAIRYWCAGSSVGSDIPYKEQNLESGERLVRKLWNASILVSNLLENEDTSKPNELQSSDEWILSEFDGLCKEVSEHYEKYEYEKARRKTRTFFWHTFCDNYLEIAKQRNDSKSLSYTVEKIHKGIIKQFYPIIPFACQYVWDEMYQDSSGAIVNSGWPTVDVSVSNEMKHKGEAFINVISSVRDWKSSRGMSLNDDISKIIVFEDLEVFKEDIKSVTHADEVEFKSTSDMSIEISLNYDVLGPKFGSETKKIEQYIENGDFEMADEGILVGGEYKLGKDEFDIERTLTSSNSEDVVIGETSLKIYK